MRLKDQYSSEELVDLQGSAQELLGQELLFHQLHIPASAVAQLRERVIDSRQKAIMVISEVDLYATQSPDWQEKVERGAAGRGPRKAGQIYSDFSNANPLISVVLQRSSRAQSDPLAVIKKIMVATGVRKIAEFSWKKLLTDPSIGIPSEQLLSAMDAMNFANVGDSNAPVQLQPIAGIQFEDEEQAPGAEAHADLQSKLRLTPKAKEHLKAVLAQLFRDRNSH